MVVSANCLYIDFQGDARGSANLQQVSAQTGEVLSNTTNSIQAVPVANTPYLMTIGSDGKAYYADKRKSMNQQLNGSFSSSPNPNRNNPTGIFVPTAANIVSSAVASGTYIVIQKAGVVTGFSCFFDSL